MTAKTINHFMVLLACGISSVNAAGSTNDLPSGDSNLRHATSSANQAPAANASPDQVITHTVVPADEARLTALILDSIDASSIKEMKDDELTTMSSFLGSDVSDDAASIGNDDGDDARTTISEPIKVVKKDVVKNAQAAKTTKEVTVTDTSIKNAYLPSTPNTYAWGTQYPLTTSAYTSSSYVPSTTCALCNAQTYYAPTTTYPSYRLNGYTQTNGHVPTTTYPYNSSGYYAPTNGYVPTAYLPYSWHAPNSNALSSNTSSSYAPSTNAPSTNAPSTNAPSTNAPSTNAPSTSNMLALLNSLFKW